MARGGGGGALAIKMTELVKMGVSLTSIRAPLLTALLTGARGKISFEKGILLLQKQWKFQNKVNNRLVGWLVIWLVGFEPFPHLTLQLSPCSLLVTQLSWTSPEVILSSYGGWPDLHKSAPPLPP